MREPGAVEESEGFDLFLRAIDRPLREALVASLGSDRGGDAHAVALAYAWRHAERVSTMASPIGYLYRVGRSGVRVRRRRPDLYPEPEPQAPEYEPRLPAALARLPEQQRVAVFLVVGCGWPAAEVGRLRDVSESTVRAHVQRGLAQLRRSLGVEDSDG